MIIRRVGDGDVASLFANRLCGLTVEETAEWVRLGVEGEAGEEFCFLVAVEGDDVVGMVTVRRLEHRMRRHRVELGGFVIVPAARGTGLARRIVAAAGRCAGEWGCSVMEVSCRGGTEAERAYLGLGFDVWGRLGGGLRDRDGLVYDEVRLWMPVADVDGGGRGAVGQQVDQ